MRPRRTPVFSSKRRAPVFSGTRRSRVLAGPSSVRRRSTLRRVALAATLIGAAAPAVRHRLRLPRPVTSVLAWQAPLALALAVSRSRGRDAAIYALQMWAYVAHYELPNDKPDEILERLRVDYPIRIDRAIGFGEAPTIRLQRALGREGAVRTHDTVLSWIHWSWFFFPHGSITYILLRHRGRFGRAATQVAAVFDLGVVVYFLVPTAPPWWAARNRRLPPVRRIMTEAGERFWGRAWVPLYDSLSGNPFAAMPSLHFATSVMSAHVLSDIGRLPGAAGWSYTAALGFALVYLGEHYVVDLVAGLALAEGVRRLAPLAEPAVRSIQGAIQRLEPTGC